MSKYKPAFLITANGADITAQIKQRLVRFNVVDESGMESDVLHITLADHDPAHIIAVPKAGAELKVWLGYGPDLQDMGSFVVDEISLQGPPSSITISAKAATFDKTPSGKTPLNTMKTRSWPKGTKLGAMAATIAKEHGLTLAMDAELQKIELPHFDQHAESDLHMLLRFGKIYDMAVKPANGALTLTKRGKLLSASGKALPAATIDAADLASWAWALSTRNAGGTVTAYWHSGKKGKRTDVSVGDGSPVKILKHPYKSDAEARAAAMAEHDKRVRGMTKVSLTTVGRPDLVAEAPLTVTGHIRPELNTKWLITKATHTFDGSGYHTAVELETPLGE